MKLSNANIKYYDTLNFDISCMIFHQEYYIFVTFSIKSPDQSTNENQKKKKKIPREKKEQRTQHGSSTGTNRGTALFEWHVTKPRERRRWRGWNDSILDLIFIQGIPRRQEFRAIKHSLSFDEPASSCVTPKGEPITADYAVVRLHAVTPSPLILNENFLLADSGSRLTLSLSFSPLPLPRVRIIPYNYIRFGTIPSGHEIEIELSCDRWQERTKTNRTQRSETGETCA